jgi:hypothetical protein
MCEFDTKEPWKEPEFLLDVLRRSRKRKDGILYSWSTGLRRIPYDIYLGIATKHRKGHLASNLVASNFGNLLQASFPMIGEYTSGVR